MTRNRRWYVQLAFGFLAMLASMGLVDRYITPAEAAPARIDLAQAEASSTSPDDALKVRSLKSPAKARGVVPAIAEKIPGRVEPKLPEFWVGLRCHAPIPDVLRAHVDIPEGQGLLVVDVVDQGPGQKGGIKKNDILMNVGRISLRSVNDLIQTIEVSGGKAVEVGLLRAGKPVSITLTPEKRPDEMRRPAIPAIPNTPGMEQIQRWFEQGQPGLSYKQPMRLRFFHRGAVLPPDALIHPGLPEGMSISIFRSGKKPAEIVVKRYNMKTQKEQTWKLTEKELGQLPADIRLHVDRMLNGVIVGAMPQFDFMPSLDENPSGSLPKAGSALRQQMQQMQDQMDQMNQMMDRMKQEMLGAEPALMP